MDEEIKILVISPYESMVRIVEKVASEFKDINLTTVVGNLNDGTNYAVDNYNEQYDYIISRGGTAKYIRNAVSVPIIEIGIKTCDLLAAINTAISTASRLAIIGFNSIIQSLESLDSLENILPFECKVYGINDVFELESVFQTIRNDNVKTVLCDTISYEYAQNHGFDAFLLTSGEDSIRDAFNKALFYHKASLSLREENRFLNKLIELNNESATVVYSSDYKLYYVSLTPNDKFMLKYLYKLLDKFKTEDSFKLIKRQGGSVYNISARKVSIFDKYYYVFFFSRRVPAASGERRCIHYYDSDEIKQEVENSVFGIVNMENYYLHEIEQCISRKEPVLISGEVGAGKDHLAKMIYLKGIYNHNPFVVIDCSLINSRAWNYLLLKPDSPICDYGNTLFIKNIDALNHEKLDQLLSAISLSDAARRNHILISRSEQRNLSILREQLVLKTITKLKCLNISMIPLRGSSNVIENSITQLMQYFKINYEHAPESIEPEAVTLLSDYNWPQNYEQLMRVMEKLAFLAGEGVITQQHVSETLRVEISFVQGETQHTSKTIINLTKNLDSINRDIAKIILEQNNGNQSETARSLGISRTTLWRMLKE